MSRRFSRRGGRGGSTNRDANTPPIMTALNLYLDPEYVAGLSNVSGETQSVTSRVGGHIFTAPAAGQRPAYGAVLNSRFGWTFAPANSEVLSNLSSTFAPLLDGSQSFTFYHVVDRDSTAAQHNLFATSDAVGAAGDCMHWGALSGANGDYFVRIDGGASTVNTSAVVYPTGLSVETLVFNGTTVSTWFNGVPFLVAAANTRVLAAQTRAAIGALVLGSTYSLFWNGKLGKQLCYLAAHDATQLAAVETWLRSFYGI
jgi:hypothetical protein